MRKFLSWPVRVHLLLLVILLALPSITLIVYWGVVAREQAIEDAKGDCLKFVNAIAGEQQAVVAGVQQLAATLALLPEVQTRNAPATDTLLSDLLKKNPLYANIVISYKSGVLWATATPAGAPFEGTLSIAGRKYFQDSVRSGTFASGEFSVGRIGKKPVMTFAQPVTNASRELAGIIAISLDLDHVQSLFENIHLPPGSSFSLLDHRGVILLRNSRDPFSEQLVGKPDTREEIFTKMVEGPDEGTYEALGNDGKVRLTAYRKIRLPHESQPYLYIRSSIPKASIVSEANKAMLGNMAALMSVFAVGLILAVFIGKRMIADPIAKLKEASRQLAEGPAPVNISGQVREGELGELAHAFDDMAEALLRKEKLQLAAEDALRASEERHKLLAETMLQGVVHQDSEGTIVSMNPAAERILGKTCREFLGSSSAHEERHTIREDGSPFPGMEHPSMVALRTGQPVRDVLMGVFNPRESAHRWISIDAVPVFRPGEDRPHEVYTVFADITERKRAEEVLQSTLQRFYLMLASMYSGVLLMTDEGRIEFVNQAFCDYYGLKESPTDLTGLASHDLLERIRPAYRHPDQAASRIREIIQRGQPFRGEEIDMQDGRTALRDFIPLIVNGKSCGRLWIHVDITDLKRAEMNAIRQTAIMEGINRIFLEAIRAGTEEQLGEICLATAEELTGSRIGFIGEIGADGKFYDIAISNPGWEACLMYDREGHRRPPGEFGIKGLYGRVLLTGESAFSNNPSSEPDIIGLPDGHPPLESFLGVPLQHDGQTVGMIAVGNRDDGYSGMEKETLEALAPAIVEAFLRKRAEAALLKAKEQTELDRKRLETILDASPSAIVLVEAEGGRLSYLNRHAMELYGTDYAGFDLDTHMARVKALKPDGAPFPVEEMPVSRSLLFGEEVRNVEMVIERADGKRFPVIVNSAPLRNAEGRITSAIVLFDDVSDLKKAEGAAREGEERLHFALEASHTGAWDLDLTDHTAFRSLEHDRIFGYAELLPQWTYNMFLDHVLPEDRDEVDAKFRQAIETQSHWSFECRIRRTDGEVRWIWATGRHSAEAAGTPHRMAGIVQDITERKRAEEALRKAKDELEERVKERTYELYAESLYARSLIEASLDPLVTISIDGKVTDVNLASEEVTGVSREKLIGSDFSDYFTEPEKARAGYESVFRLGFVRDYPLELKRLDGHVTPVLYNASVYRDEAGQIMGVFAAARDITERKHAEAALRRLASELVMAEERERKRIAGVLHDEIAQILATIRMRLDILEGLPSEQQEILKEAKALLLQSIQETRTLMTDIGNPLLFDMGLKAACESLAKRLMERHAVRIRCDIRDAYKHLSPDVKTILFQVIRELLNNVVKHSRAQNAHVTIDMDNGHFSMKVTDDGAGFDPQMLGAPTVDGGFGLYSIRERLLAIGGSLRIESAPGTGTVVTAILPAALD